MATQLIGSASGSAAREPLPPCAPATQPAATPGSRSESRATPAAGPQGEYRPDIDGLRAVAILSVLGFHAFSRALPGGFVGVDVFFVISGYLITGIILQELLQGRFSFRDFYARRVRRIFPALLLVLAVVWGLGWLKLFPDEFAALTRHVAAGAYYVSNLLLDREAGYFDVDAALKPLLHLWSLGVEEQFYIFWPLLLVASWRWRAGQLLLLAGLALGSFGLNVARIAGHPTSTFYLPDTRIWELALGGLLAHRQLVGWPHATQRPATAALRGVPQRILLAIAHARALLQRPAAREGLAALGALLIGIALVCFDPRQLFPGWRALVPTCGALLLIGAGPHTRIARRVLATRPMVFIGLISYPLYLWHWPLLSMSRVLHDGYLTLTEALSALAVAAVLAVLTYYGLERPLRERRPAWRPAVPLFLAVTALGLAAYVSHARGLQPLSARYGVQRLLRAGDEQAFPDAHLHRLGEDPDLRLLDSRRPTRVLMLGDSNMEQYYPRIERLVVGDPAHSRSVLFATHGGCPPIPGIEEVHHPGCEGVLRDALAAARDPRIDSVVIAAAWAGYFVDPDPRYDYRYVQDSANEPIFPPTAAGVRPAFAALGRLIDAFRALGKRVYVVLQIPDVDAIDPHDMFARGWLDFGFRAATRPLSRASLTRRYARLDASLTQLARQHGAAVVDPLDALCDRRSCPIVDGAGEPMYKDGGHLRPSYVREHVRYLDGLIRLQ